MISLVHWSDTAKVTRLGSGQVVQSKDPKSFCNLINVFRVLYYSVYYIIVVIFMIFDIAYNVRRLLHGVANLKLVRVSRWSGEILPSPFKAPQRESRDHLTSGAHGVWVAGERRWRFGFTEQWDEATAKKRERHIEHWRCRDWISRDRYNFVSRMRSRSQWFAQNAGWPMRKKVFIA